MEIATKMAIAAATLAATWGLAGACTNGNPKDCCVASYEIKQNAETGVFVATPTEGGKSIHFELK